MVDFVHRLEVRFRDCDPLGHVNNAVYFTYLEQTRFQHWRALWGFGTSDQRPDMPGVILAHAECDFKRQVKHGETIEIRLTVAELGRSSFRYTYEIVDADQRLVATASTVQVMYDYRQSRPVPIPDEIRQLLTSSAATGR
jgi:acyl-CoA thioester hydrolase